MLYFVIACIVTFLLIVGSFVLDYTIGHDSGELVAMIFLSIVFGGLWIVIVPLASLIGLAWLVSKLIIQHIETKKNEETK